MLSFLDAASLQVVQTISKYRQLLRGEITGTSALHPTRLNQRTHRQFFRIMAAAFWGKLSEPDGSPS